MTTTNFIVSCLAWGLFSAAIFSDFGLEHILGIWALGALVLTAFYMPYILRRL